MKNILIVDDEKSFLLSLSEGLGAYPGLRLITAEDGKTAAEYVATVPLDLVITDLEMPVMDGFELLKFIHERHPGIPVIVMTAFSSPETEQRLRSLGVLWYLEKPLDLDLVSAAIFLGLSDARGSMQARGITPLTFQGPAQVKSISKPAIFSGPEKKEKNNKEEDSLERNV